MKVALVCIAKDEDNYIDEWLLYHLKLGFFDIFVNQNNWRYSGNICDEHVHFLNADGEAMQLPAYNRFIQEQWHNYDFAAFMDVDEFLCLKRHTSINDFLALYHNYYGVAINWRFFGDSGHTCVHNGNYSLLKRFIKCQSILDRHVKTILNFNKCHNMFNFVNPHFIDASIQYDVITDVDMTRFVHGPWNYGCISTTAQINHYFSKTIEEFRGLKMKRGKADTLVSHPAYNYFEKQFMEHNYNEIEDRVALDFWLSKNSQKES